MIELKPQNITYNFDVVILGAGLSGTLCALELPSYLNIALVEVGNEIINKNSTSFNQCNKLHLGLHYAGDSETAVKCLEDSLLFANQYKDYLRGNVGEPWRRGRHFIMSNSLFPLGQVTEVSEVLKKSYRDLAKDANYIFGKTEDFIRDLRPDEYPQVAKAVSYIDQNGDSNFSSIVKGFETAESQIDIHLLKSHLKRRIEQSNNITFIPNHKAKKITFEGNNLNYEILLKNTKTLQEFILSGKNLINSTWQNIEKLDFSAGQIDERLVRIKASILVRLPLEISTLNTCIFSIGPFCSFTNLGNGLAVVTEESVSNLGFYSVYDELDPLLNTLIKSDNRLSHYLGKEVALSILAKASKYIPSLNKAKIEDLHIGFVKIHTHNKPYSLYSPHSSIHSRIESGVEQKGLGYISASGMKMTYTYHNAVTIKKLLTKHSKIKNSLLILLQNCSNFTHSDLTPSFKQQEKLILGIRSYLSSQNHILLNEISNILPDWQLKLIIKQHPSLYYSHAILTQKFLSAA